MKSYITKACLLLISIVFASAFLTGCGPKDNSDYWRSKLKKANSESQKLEYMLNLAQALDSEKRYAEAVKEYDAILATKSKKHFFIAMNNKGFTLFNMGKYEEALPIFQALSANPPDKKFSTSLHSNIAMCYHKMKKYDLALKEYNLALELNAENKNAKVGLGILRQDLQQQAAENAKKAAEPAAATGTESATGTKDAGADGGDKPETKREKSGAGK